jgi:hypothetical protein
MNSYITESALHGLGAVLRISKELFRGVPVITRARTDNWSQKKRTKKGAEPKPCPIKNNLDYFFNATLKAMIALFNFLTSSWVTVFLAKQV